MNHSTDHRRGRSTRLARLFVGALLLATAHRAAATNDAQQKFAGTAHGTTIIQRIEKGDRPDCDICLEGSVSYDRSGATILLTAERVRNYRSGGRSGTLDLELWLTDSPYGGGNIFGYRTASHRLGELDGSSFFFNISSGTIGFQEPPPGSYRVTMLVTEFGNGITDYVAFDDPFVVGGGGPDPGGCEIPCAQGGNDGCCGGEFPVCAPTGGCCRSSNPTDCGTHCCPLGTTCGDANGPDPCPAIGNPGPGGPTPGGPAPGAPLPIAPGQCSTACSAQVGACQASCPRRGKRRKRCRKKCVRNVVAFCQSAGSCG
ncbi:MAG TPA: hypothetical protein VGR62_25025 [Candidatus Binatia bacterium]|jgi:hypothetical protein|nr:hypothetical protein [Candidatus Binatia bacterium]